MEENGRKWVGRGWEGRGDEGRRGNFGTEGRVPCYSMLWCYGWFLQSSFHRESPGSQKTEATRKKQANHDDDVQTPSSPSINQPTRKCNSWFPSSWSTFLFPLSYLILGMRLDRSGWMLQSLHTLRSLLCLVLILPGLPLPFLDNADAHCSVLF